MILDFRGAKAMRRTSERLWILGGIAIALACGPLFAQQKLVPVLAPGHSVAMFGENLAVQGGDLVVAAPAGDGFVEIYRHAGKGWTPVQRLVPVETNNYGYRLATSREWLAVASRNVSGPNWQSYVDLYRRGPEEWEFVQRVSSPEQDSVGYVRKMAVTSHALMVGIERYDFNGNIVSRDVYVYSYAEGSWGSPQLLAPPAGASADFGYAIAAVDDALAISDPGDSSGGRNGVVWTYTRGAGAWVRGAMIGNSRPRPLFFGSQLAFCGGKDRLTVSTTNISGGATPTGIVSVYRGGGGGWSIDGPELVPPSGVPWAGFFGRILACDAGSVIVGSIASQGVHVTALAGARVLQPIAVLDPDAVSPGFALALDGGSVMLGDPNGPPAPSAPSQRIGTVFVFDKAIDVVFPDGFE